MEFVGKGMGWDRGTPRNSCVGSSEGQAGSVPRVTRRSGRTNGAGGRAEKKALLGIGFPSAGNVKFQVPI